MIGPSGFMQAPKSDPCICRNCANWTRRTEERGNCSEKKADKISTSTVEDYSCRFFKSFKGGAA